MSSRRLAAAILGLAALALPSIGLASERAASSLIPSQAVVVLRLENPVRLEQEIANLNLPPDALPPFRTLVFQFLRLPPSAGVAADRPWYFVLDEGPKKEARPWFLLPIADEGAFHVALAGTGLPLTTAFREDYALLGVGPLPSLGGSPLAEGFTRSVELHVDTATIARRSAEEVAQVQERAEKAAVDPVFRRQSDPAPEALPAFLAAQMNPAFQQSRRLDIGLDVDAGRLAFALAVDYEPETPWGKFVARQKPRAPEGLGRVDLSLPVVVWTNVQTGEAVPAELVANAGLEPLVSEGANRVELKLPFFATDARPGAGEPPLSMDQVVATGLVSGTLRIEGVEILAPEDVPTRRNSLLKSLPAGPSARLERSAKQIGAMDVDSFSQQLGPQGFQEIYVASGERKLFYAGGLAAAAGRGFELLRDLTDRPEVPYPERVARAIASFPKNLVSLGWLDTVYFARAKVPAGPTPLVAFYATTRGSRLELGGALELKDFVAWWKEEDGARTHARLQAETGKNYYCGRGVARDYAKAVEWYRQAAELNDPGGQTELGIAYELGTGVAEDSAEAARWYRKAAAQGYPEAQYRLGVLHQEGRGVPQDHAEAVRWFGNAAQQNHMGGQRLLGWKYEEGRGVAQDWAQAIHWYRKAAEQNDVWAQNKLGRLYREGSGVPKDYDEAAKWFRKSAEQNSVEAERNLARAYQFGEGVPKDFAQAAEWYRKAADQDDLYALYNLAWLYEQGLGLPRSQAEAAKWYRRAAERGDPRGQFCLGRLYLMGAGVRQDFVEAYFWLTLAAAGAEKEEQRKLAEGLLAGLKTSMTPAQKTQARKRVEELKSKASALAKTP